MELAARISEERLAARVGSRQQVLVDTVETDEGGEAVAVARGYADAPEIDGTVRIAGAGVARLKAGEFATVEITHADTYDLHARLA
jgi:ribosomal protein S12 methylthiotransferase